MATLILTIGLPASGKTTRARQWVADVVGLRQHGDVATRARINRDDYRDMMFGGWTGQAEHEDAVTGVQHAAIRELLTAGVDVVVDDTNLHPEHLQALSEIGWACGVVSIGIWDMTNVPVDECVRRDKLRAAAGERAVGEDVIRGMWQKHQERPAATGDDR